MRAFKILFLIFILSINACALRETFSIKETSAWDFGKVEEGSVLEHIFMLKNGTDKPLIIKRLDTSCGCTVSNISTNNISPGEIAKLKVSFDTRGYEGDVQQYVYVHTDSAQNPVIEFTISAEVVKK